MSAFDLVEVHNIADETINFGLRNLADGENLCETATLATIRSSSDEENVHLHLNARLFKSQIYFNTNNCMRIFKDRECSEIIFNANFEAIIDVFCMSHDGKYLLLCLRSGKLQVMVLSDDVQCIFDQYVEDNQLGEPLFINCFVGGNGFIVITRTGKVFRLSSEPTFALNEVYNVGFKVNHVAFNGSFLLLQGTKLATIDIYRDIVEYGENLNARKIISANGGLFLILDSEGNLFRYCAQNLLINPFNNNTLYKDVELLSDGNEEMQILSVVENESGETVIQLLKYLQLTIIYSLKVANDIYLIPLETSNDDILYISRIKENSYDRELRLQTIYETQPTQRLLRLLKRQQFEEAEHFAAIYNLDASLINKAKAQIIVDKSLCKSEDIDNLIEILDCIDDDEFKLQACFEVESFCCESESVRKILTYGSKIAPRKQLLLSDSLKSIPDLMHRFDTWTALNMRGHYSQSWTKFSKCDLMEELILFLKNHQIEEAIIIYNRLDSQACEMMSDEILADIIAVVNNIPVSICKPFLATFIPISLSICSSLLPSLVKWTHNRILFLEHRCKTEFPDNAIAFAEYVIKLMKIDENDFFNGVCRYPRDSLVELSGLMTALKTAKDLKDNFSIQVPILGFLEGPKKFIRLLLDLSLCPEDHSNLIKNFLYKFIAENNFEPNEIFMDEIKNLMNYSEKHWIRVIPSILKCITSVESKLEAIKYILNYASVPWNSVLREIINESLSYSHDLVAAIKNIVKTESALIVLAKPKYRMNQKYKNDIHEFRFFVRKIIHVNDPEMVKDVYMFCEDDDNKRHWANIQLITHFISIGNLEEAINILENNTEKEIKACAKVLSDTIEMYVNNKYNFPQSLIDNFFKMSNAIIGKLENTNDDFKKTTLPLMECVQSLKKSFNVVTTTDELRKKDAKQRICDKIIEDILQQFQTQEHVDNGLTKFNCLARSLSMKEEDILIQACTLSTSYKILVQLVDRADLSEFSIGNLRVLMLLLVKRVGTYNFVLKDDSDLSDESFCQNEDNEDELFCKGLRLSSKIAAKIISKESPADTLACIDDRWANAGFYLIRDNHSTLTSTLFGDKFYSTSLLPSYHTFTGIRTIFNLVTTFIDQYQHRHYLVNPNDKHAQIDVVDKFKGVPSLLDNLLKEGQLFTAFRILDIAQKSLIESHIFDSNILTFLRKLQRNLIPKLLSSIAANNVIDEDLFYILLLRLDEAEATALVYKITRLYRRNPNKYSSMSRIGLKFFQLYENQEAVQVMMDSLVTLKWWKKLKTKKLTYDSFFKSTPQDRIDLLITSGCLSFPLIEEFSAEYQLEPKPSYASLLTHVLHNWKVEYEVEVDNTGNRHLHLKNQDVLLKKCEEIMTKIDKETVLKTITLVCATINPYQYETFITIVSILKQLGATTDYAKKSLALNFLMNYRRVNKPSEAESEYWYTLFPDTQQLDPLSEFRLPFTPQLFTQQIFDIIRPELNLKNYRCWFDITSISEPYLNINDICSYVVKDIVATGILTRDVTDWVFHPQHEDLMKEIDKCVLHITDHERRTSVVYYLMTHMPSGADQVNVAKLCYKYASMYKEHNIGSPVVEKAFLKVEKKYFSYCAIHILHLFKLAEPKYLQLVSQSYNLICNLYMDERILGKNNMLYVDCPDINKATEALADLFNLDIEDVRSGLVENWLSDHPTNEVIDSSLVFNSNTCSEEDNLKRVAYICLSKNLQKWQSYLFERALGQKAEKQSIQFRVKALKIFTMISDVDKIEEIGLTYAEFMNFIDKLTIVGNVQTLGIALDFESLEKQNKKELLKCLVQRAGNMLGIQTMALICMTYEIYGIKHWEFIIEAAVKLSMISELKTYVKFLKQPEFRYKSFYMKAWQKIMDHLFTAVGNSALNEIDNVLLQTFLKIQICPIVYNLKFENAFAKCMNLGKVEYAAVLVQYMVEDRRKSCVEAILSLNNQLLSEKLNKLVDSGLVGVTYVQSLLRSN